MTGDEVIPGDSKPTVVAAADATSDPTAKLTTTPAVLDGPLRAEAPTTASPSPREPDEGEVIRTCHGFAGPGPFPVDSRCTIHTD